jgi:single-strand DNA-binding protein
MASLSKTLLIGYLGQDPEKRVTSGGHSVVSVNLSTTERWKDKQGNRQEKTEWHKLQVWGEQADRFESWLKKGSCVYIENQQQQYQAPPQQNYQQPPNQQAPQGEDWGPNGQPF